MHFLAYRTGIQAGILKKSCERKRKHRNNLKCMGVIRPQTNNKQMRLLWFLVFLLAARLAGDLRLAARGNGLAKALLRVCFKVATAPEFEQMTRL